MLLRAAGRAGVSLRPARNRRCSGETIPMRCRFVFGVVVVACARLASADPLYTVKDLGLVPGGTSSAANAINASGVVVGASAISNGTHLFRYSQGTLQDLGTFPGAEDTTPLSINLGGQIVG